MEFTAQEEESRQKSQQAGVLQAIAWDPSRPYALLVPTATVTSSKDDERTGDTDVAPTSLSLDTLFSHAGTGCNEHELTALLQLLAAHEEFHLLKHNNDNTSKETPMDSFKSLFRTYRGALLDCLSDWNDAMSAAESKDEAINSTKNEYTDALEHLELLRMNYSVLHLSSVFLPLLPSQYRSSLELSFQDPYSIPGLATADTVRYLRYNHTLYMDDEDARFTPMLSAVQPEHFDSNDDDDQDDELFWQLVTKLVLRGCLEQAWTVLSKHSSYVAATTFNNQKHSDAQQNVDPQYAASMKEMERGFLELRELLLRAPIPAGRTDVRDNDLDVQDELEELGEPASYLLDDLHVTSTDYKFWETASSGAADLPLDFQGDMAKRQHKQWQDYIQDMQRSGFRLSRKIPQMERILDILSGDLSNVSFATWAEQLLAELLYKRPDMKPCSLSRRARRIVQDFDETANPHLVDALLKIMEGNAGEAIQLLFGFGAGSGAALPATMLALLFSLFVDAKILPPSENERKIDFLCQAAWAVQTSLGDVSRHDMGAQLAVRLLLPYAMEPGSGEIFRATIALILEHYSPSSDHFAKTLISQCLPLIERKSLQILEACTGVLLNLHSRQTNENSKEAAVLSLIDGLELEALVLPNATVGACSRTLTRTCLSVVNDLLKIAVGDAGPEGDEWKSHSLAQAIATAFNEFPASKVEEIPDAILTVRVLSLFDALALYQKELAFLQENCVVELLSEVFSLGKDDITGNVTIRNFHWYLLRIATNLLDSKTDPSPGPSFGKTAIVLMMEYLTQLSAVGSHHCPYSSEQVAELEERLAEGLAHAMVVENLRKKSSTAFASRDPREDLVGIQTCNLDSYSLDTQERFVQELLEGT